jgi:hypothetical protein
MTAVLRLGGRGAAGGGKGPRQIVHFAPSARPSASYCNSVPNVICSRESGEMEESPSQETRDGCPAQSRTGGI